MKISLFFTLTWTEYTDCSTSFVTSIFQVVDWSECITFFDSKQQRWLWPESRFTGRCSQCHWLGEQASESDRALGLPIAPCCSYEFYSSIGYWEKRRGLEGLISFGMMVQFLLKKVLRVPPLLHPSTPSLVCPWNVSLFSFRVSHYPVSSSHYQVVSMTANSRWRICIVPSTLPRKICFPHSLHNLTCGSQLIASYVHWSSCIHCHIHLWCVSGGFFSSYNTECTSFMCNTELS